AFITAGMGGGTGTGAAPVIARAAKEQGILTVGVVTKPFHFEGARRLATADRGIEELARYVDTLIVIPNQNLFLVAKAETTFKEAFQLADEVLQQGVRSITDLMVMPGLINLDFADVRSVMGEMGKAMMGTGEGEGVNRALEAAERAIANPLLDGVSMQGAKGVIISIIGGDDMKLLEVDEAANHIRELVDPNANIIWGSAFNPDLQGRIRVSVVATGIEQTAEMAQEAAKPFNLGVSRGPVRPGGDAAAPSRLYNSGEAEPEVSVPQAYEPAPEPVAADEGDELELSDFAENDEAQAEAADAADDDAMELSTEADDSDADAEQPQAQTDAEPAGDDLLGEATRLAQEDGESSSLLARKRPLVSSNEEDGERAPRLPGAGSTLFERMANLSRGGGAAAEEEEEDDDSAAEAPSISIPRFLGRQNNQ
ncbi:MAG: cell division protein FtsZ, partial [Novosphingobium sp.]